MFVCELIIVFRMVGGEVMNGYVIAARYELLEAARRGKEGEKVQEGGGEDEGELLGHRRSPSPTAHAPSLPCPQLPPPPLPTDEQEADEQQQEQGTGQAKINPPQKKRLKSVPAIHRRLHFIFANSFVRLHMCSQQPHSWREKV
ncbi:unnamed protein product [Vitrella brassicaformis CCMP3155]|uniref:Uncharacterized protein n=1 Tax=Vitrella brassicaformis (strain CCMP3155) TaxID=1169540 RepID=A0A0G4FVT9_VITBC|nr:unnamed protein product [Vitrella brassicaformis CCMP3155]|eukprot:CEM18713.1 unnamed protein product [Vitrella brassicaformis CCMP3155]